MAENTNAVDRTDWIEGSGLRHILRTLGFAVHPSKLGLALAAVVLTFLLGTVLDVIWSRGHGVGDAAVTEFVRAQLTGQRYEEPDGDHGIFEVWWKHQRRCIAGLLDKAVPGVSHPPDGADALMPAGQTKGILNWLFDSLYGVMWLFTQHIFYFLFFAVGALLIWALAGGGICRIASVQVATGERRTLGEGLRFARANLLGGFVLAPCVPAILAAVTMILLALGGMLLRVPVVGDLIAGVAFGLALLGGFVVACLLVGTVIGGSLFWPAIAAEGQDAYDSFSRSMSYVFTKPWKTILYAAIATCFMGISWMIVRFFVSLSLGITHHVVAFGTSPFGWWPRGAAGSEVSKLDLLWTHPAAAGSYSWPNWGELSVFEYVSGFLIGVWILLVAALLWAFLASFYFSGSTIVYFLLRRDVDGIDLEDVHMTDDADDGTQPSNEAAPAPAATATTTDAGTSSARNEASAPAPTETSPPAAAPPPADARPPTEVPPTSSAPPTSAAQPTSAAPPPSGLDSSASEPDDSASPSEKPSSDVAESPPDNGAADTESDDKPGGKPNGAGP